MTEKWIIKNGKIVDTESSIIFDSFMEIVIVLNGQSRKLNNLHEENISLKYKNELLQDELKQCKAVIDKKWREYLKEKELICDD